MAGRVGQAGAADAPATVDRAYRLAYGRPPSAAEAARACAFLAAQAADHAATGRPPGEASAAALADFCQMLLASNEFLHVE